MVIQIRVDARLIHGQVVLGWTRELNTPGILVIDNEAATTDKLTFAGLNMAVQAAGNGLKLMVKTLEDGIKVVQNPKMVDYRVFLITRYLDVAWEVIKQCPGRVLAVNCANMGYHKEEIPEEERVRLYNATCNKRDIECINNMVNTEGLDVFHQITPNYRKEMMVDILKADNLYNPGVIVD